MMKKKKIGFIGAGKVGVGLGAYFVSKGLNVSGYLSRSLESSENAAEITNSYAFSDTLHLADGCDIIFITTPDDSIGGVWNELVKFNIRGKIICHTSGSLSSAVFENAAQYGAFVYSIHPMYAFANKNGAVMGLENACFSIEGDKACLQDLRKLISELGNKTLIIKTDKKVLYHISNVMASNLVLALLSIASDCIEESGVKGEDSIQALMPLINGNINNICEKGFVNSLTGPIERNDILTLNKHLEALPKKFGKIYAELSLQLTNIAKQKHSDRCYDDITGKLYEYIEREF